MLEHRKSDRPVVPVKLPNKPGSPVAEGVEGRGLAKGNLRQQHAPRTPSRTRAPMRWTGTPSGSGASSPEAGAGCGSAARPDLWRGSGATLIPTPKILIV